MTAPAEPAPQPRWRRRLRRALGVAFVTPIAGAAGLWLALAHDPLDPAYGGPAPLPPELAARYAYPEAGSPVPVLAEFNHVPGRLYTSRWVHFTVTTPGEVEPHRVQVIHYEPHEPGPRAAVVITPIYGGDNQLARLMGAALAARGIHGAVVLRAEKVLDPTAPVERVERVLRTAIVDRRRTIDWLQGRPDVDPARIGAFGVSMGGIATALLAAADQRVQASVLVLAGGELEDVVVSSTERSIRRYVDECEAGGLPPDELRRRLAAAIVSDPAELARYVDARRVLFVQARWDEAVPSRDQERLYQALGRPARTLLPTGHYSAAVYLPYLLWRSLGFLEARLAAGS